MTRPLIVARNSWPVQTVANRNRVAKNGRMCIPLAGIAGKAPRFTGVYTYQSCSDLRHRKVFPLGLNYFRFLQS